MGILKTNSIPYLTSIDRGSEGQWCDVISHIVRTILRLHSRPVDSPNIPSTESESQLPWQFTLRFRIVLRVCWSEIILWHIYHVVKSSTDKIAALTSLGMDRQLQLFPYHHNSSCGVDISLANFGVKETIVTGGNPHFYNNRQCILESYLPLYSLNVIIQHNQHINWYVYLNERLSIMNRRRVYYRNSLK